MSNGINKWVDTTVKPCKIGSSHVCTRIKIVAESKDIVFYTNSFTTVNKHSLIRGCSNGS